MAESDSKARPRIFIGNLPLQVTEPEIKSFFEQIGKVDNIFVPVNRRTGESKGVAYVEYADKSLIPEAIEKFHQADFKGRALRVSLARSQDEEEADKREKRRSQMSRNQYHRDPRNSRDDDRESRYERRDRDRDERRRHYHSDDDERSSSHHRNRDRDEDRHSRDRDKHRENSFPPPLFYPPPISNPEYARHLFQLYGNSFKDFTNQFTLLDEKSKMDPLAIPKMPESHLQNPYSNYMYPNLSIMPNLPGGMPMVPGMMPPLPNLNPAFPAPMPSADLLSSFPPPTFDLSRNNDRDSSSRKD